MRQRKWPSDFSSLWMLEGCSSSPVQAIARRRDIDRRTPALNRRLPPRFRGLKGVNTIDLDQ